MRFRPALELVVLVVALVGQAVVLYYVDTPLTRLSFGLFLLAPIVWASSRLGILELITHTRAERVYKRRFVRLRSQVQQLLDEVRRLNWMAVDADRGFRNRKQALKEMDRIEERLRELIQQIRDAAGKISAESEVFEGAADEQPAAR